MTSNQLKAREIEETRVSNMNKEALEVAKLPLAGKGRGMLGGFQMAYGSAMAPVVNDEIAKNRGKKGQYGNDYSKSDITVRNSINDASWYLKDPQLVEDAASIAYGKPLGSGLETYAELETASGTRTNKQTAVPGLLVVEYIPSLPDKSTMNVAAKKLYAYVRHANSGHTNYEANDLMMYIIAVTEAYGTIALAKRLYSILNTYKNKSYYYSKSYVEGQGFDFSTFSQNIANFRFKINNWARRMNTFAIPATFPIFLRRMWMNSNIFKDAAIGRSNNYIFKPAAYFTYSESASGSELNGLPYGNPNSKMSYTAFINVVDAMIDALFNSEDLGIISGDVMKAYKENGLFQVSEIDADYHIEEVYSPEVLSQINGGNTVGRFYAPGAKIQTVTIGTESYIVQGVNTTFEGTNDYRIQLQRESALAANTYSVPTNRSVLINQFHDDVKPIENIIATRLATIYGIDTFNTGSNTYDYRAIVLACGTEVLTTMWIIGKTLSGGALVDKVTETFDGDSFASGSLTNGTVGELVFDISCFDWAPRTRLYYKASNSWYEIFSNIDLCNFASVKDELLKKLHLTAMLSLYNI